MTLDPDNETRTARELWTLGYKALAKWKACPYSTQNPKNILAGGKPAYPLGCFVHLLK